jgi:hypothetical protein
VAWHESTEFDPLDSTRMLARAVGSEAGIDTASTQEAAPHVSVMGDERNAHGRWGQYRCRRDGRGSKEMADSASLDRHVIQISHNRERPGMSAFALEYGVVYHTYSAYARAVDAMWGMYPWLDRVPKGRNESAGPSWRQPSRLNRRSRRYRSPSPTASDGQAGCRHPYRRRARRDNAFQLKPIDVHQGDRNS